MHFYSSLLSALRRMMLVAPIVKRVPLSMTRRSLGFSSTLQAVANENYEFAARLRDEINSRSRNDETDSDLI